MGEPPKMMLLGPGPDKCQECAVKHDPQEPHDAASLFYQTKFNMEHGRGPTWDDAVAHCSTEMKLAWREGLQKHGVNLNFFTDDEMQRAPDELREQLDEVKNMEDL